MRLMQTVMAQSWVINQVAGGEDWGHMGGWGWGMAVFGWLFLLLVLGLVAWLIWLTTGRQSTDQRSRAADLLDERYARGEIDREEYLLRKSDLEP